MADVASLKVYEVDDGETHWILAATPDDAIECFYETYCSSVAERADYELSELKLADQDAVKIRDDDGDKRIPLREVVRQHLAGKYPTVPCVLASTVW